MAEKDSSSLRKRNDLSLKMKYEVIKTAEREPTIGSRKLAETFQCDRTQIQTILKNKDSINLRLYMNPMPMTSYHNVGKEQENLSMLTSMRLYTNGTCLQLPGTFSQMERS